MSRLWNARVTKAEHALASEHERDAPTKPRMTVAPSTPTRERPTRDSGGRTGDAWRVIVLNDNHNTFEGQAVVWSGHREPAELYWQSLNDLGLTMAPLER